jgi:hypothetical protein
MNEVFLECVRVVLWGFSHQTNAAADNCDFPPRMDPLGLQWTAWPGNLPPYVKGYVASIVSVSIILLT